MSLNQPLMLRPLRERLQMGVIADAAVNFPSLGKPGSTFSRLLSGLNEGLNDDYSFDYSFMWDVIEDVYKLNSFGDLSLNSFSSGLKEFKNSNVEVLIPCRKYLDPCLTASYSWDTWNEYRQNLNINPLKVRVCPPDVLKALEKWDRMNYIEYEERKSDRLKSFKSAAKWGFRISAGLGGVAGLDALFGD